jgi:hypothetical protein
MATPADQVGSTISIDASRALRTASTWVDESTSPS